MSILRASLVHFIVCISSCNRLWLHDIINRCTSYIRVWQTNYTDCTDFPNVVAQCHIFGGVHSAGLWPPNLNSGAIFVQCTYAPSFIILCLLLRKLSCWQTNRRRWKHPILFATLQCWVTRNEMHRHKGSANQQQHVVLISFPKLSDCAYTTVGCPNNTGLCSENCGKMIVWNSSLHNIAARVRSRKLWHGSTATFVAVCNGIKSGWKLYALLQFWHARHCPLLVPLAQIWLLTVSLFK